MQYEEQKRLCDSARASENAESCVAWCAFFWTGRHSEPGLQWAISQMYSQNKVCTPQEVYIQHILICTHFATKKSHLPFFHNNYLLQGKNELGGPMKLYKGTFIRRAIPPGSEYH